MSINMELAKARNLSEDTVAKIEHLHYVRRSIGMAIQRATCAGNRTIVHALAQTLPSIETALQELWGFPINISYYKFWEVNNCSCPKMDNNDNYPHGYYTINLSCWLHGEVK